MRPTITEQLEGLQRILSEVVAPEVTNPYPADILAGVIGALDALRSGWYEVPRYLRWDAAATAAVLKTAGPALGEDLAAQVAAADEAGPSDAADLAALEAHHERMRALLSTAVPIIESDPTLAEVRAAMLELFRERGQRFPFALTTRPAAPAPATPA